MKKVEINIVEDILKSSMALHEFGRSVYKVIEKQISKIDEPTLFVLNLIGADPLDYEFINIAFADIIKQNKVDPNLYLVFKAGNWEIEELFTGLTKILKLKRDADEETDKDLLIENGVHLIIIKDTGDTMYVTSSSSKHMEVLKEIEANEKTSSAEIQQKFNLNVEDTSKILSELFRNKLIYRINYSTDGPFYYAVKNSI